MNDEVPSCLTRRTHLTNDQFKAISVIFNLDERIIRKLFENREVWVLCRETKQRAAKKQQEKRKAARKRKLKQQKPPGPGSTKLLYNCKGGCGASRWLTEGEAARKNFRYYCPVCAQLYRGDL